MNLISLVVKYLVDLSDENWTVLSFIYCLDEVDICQNLLDLLAVSNYDVELINSLDTFCG